MPARFRPATLTRLLALALATTLAACGGGGDAEGPPMMAVDANGVSTFQSAALATVLASYPLQALSAAEQASLARMREEEQLAHDVYAAGAGLWPGQPVFANIAASEATHTAAVKALLDRYQLADPLAGRGAGSFPTLQALYDGLVADSAAGLSSALKVGVQVEELDLHDLATQAVAIDNADIQRVYDNLARGSRNHLRSYMRLLLQAGGSYTPQFLTQAEFDAIVNSGYESGR